MKSCSSLLLVLLMFLAFYTNGQTNTFPLYSSGAASGGSGDYTNVTNGQLKLQATSGYIRAQHISADAGVSAVFNFQTGKTVYWGETTDAGQYQFRGRDFILVNGKLGIGTSSPAYKLDVNGPINSTGGFLTSGNVGIGVTTPSGALHVNGVNANGWTYLSGNVNGAGNPANIQGLQLGWNRTGIQGESIVVYNTSTGSAPRLDFSSYNGTTYTTEMTLIQGKLGLGTSSPAYKLDVSGQINSSGILSSGNVGIGTTSPLQKLEIINGNALINGENTGFGFDALAAPRLGIVKKSGTSPMIISDNGNPIMFGQTNQAGVFTNLAGATITERMRIDAAGNVGIGKTTPAYKLDVNGAINASSILINGAPFAGGGSQWTTSGTTIYYNTAGNVGIGTSTPGAKLEVGSSTSSGTLLRVNGGAAPGNVALEVNNSGVTGTMETVIGTPSEVRVGSKTNYNFSLFSNNTDRLTIQSSNGFVGVNTATPAYQLDVNGAINATNLYINGAQVGLTAGQWTTTGANASFNLTGNVGIGSSNPDAKLTVNGTIHSKEVKVDLNVPGPDYVFEKEYNLQSLAEVEAYIDQNKHLPEVPSAKEMEKNGILVSEMNLILLKKVEELTLHLIELKKQNEDLKSRIESIEKRK